MGRAKRTHKDTAMVWWPRAGTQMKAEEGRGRTIGLIESILNSLK
jgi:hypothetical protein